MRTPPTTTPTTPPPTVEEVVGVSRPSPEVRRIELRRPERLNAMNDELVRQLHEALADAERDPRCRVVVLTGAGRGFCAGLDLNGYGDPPNAAVDPGRIHRTLGTQRDIAALVQRIRRMPQVVVAQVNGPAAGGGLALVCAADVRIAAAEAIFASSFIRIGVTGCDIGVSWMLPRLVGAGRAHELMLTARRFDAAEALRIGLLADVVPGAELATRVDRTVADLLAAPPLSLALTKQGMWLSLEIPSFDAAVEMENRQQVLTSATADAAEAMASYRGRSAPTYHHR
ncbi:enoyl-CoA hydratase/isomerase family protein [Pseudonocardia humida]|uniref:Enoyl-CoA hydratase/isomerase family protein n=1 Tax=Pseudonocardia humida TaxID=2800819 RepID=A0ABT0ZSB2_9PSEU|nr:enoyl-CoA hydratase/isomerase family protein [Pseudonocardia humida]MCO1653622.1 enoyl-CoA hydratase/isomerase family protein [Pseudonocardia humida]